MVKKTILILFFIILLGKVTPVFAVEYILPYPSYMPGNKLYNPHLLWEKIKGYWYFGNMSQVKYHQALADKYLVEAKTLFEYGQLSLGVGALTKSNNHFANTIMYQMAVTREKKDDGQQKENVIRSAHKHIEIINGLKGKLPKQIEWREEKAEPKTISLDVLFTEAEMLRTYALK